MYAALIQWISLQLTGVVQEVERKAGAQGIEAREFGGRGVDVQVNIKYAL